MVFGLFILGPRKIIVLKYEVQAQKAAQNEQYEHRIHPPGLVKEKEAAKSAITVYKSTTYLVGRQESQIHRGSECQQETTQCPANAPDAWWWGRAC